MWKSVAVIDVDVVETVMMMGNNSGAKRQVMYAVGSETDARSDVMGG